MEKFKKFEIKNKQKIIGGNFGDGKYDLIWQDTVWGGKDGSTGTDAYNKEFELIYYY